MDPDPDTGSYLDIAPFRPVWDVIHKSRPVKLIWPFGLQDRVMELAQRCRAFRRDETALGPFPGKILLNLRGG